MSKNVLFFGDFGIDDIMALIYAYYEVGINTVGIVAEYGNVSKFQAMRNALYLRDITGRDDIPIVGGAERSSLGTTPTFYPEIHGPEGFGGFIPQFEGESPEELFENFHVIYDIIEQYEGDLAIVNTGRLTSLATSFILYPETMQKVKEIYIMGGAFNFPGNVTPVAEANIWGDPYASNVVFTYAKNLTIIPLNVTQRAVLTPEMVNKIDKAANEVDNKIGKIIKPMMDFYYQFYKAQIPTIKGAPLHDLLALWATINNESFTYVNRPVKVIVSLGDAFGQTVGDLRELIQLAPYPNHNFAIDFDYDTFIARVLHVLTNDMLHPNSND
ncbi:MULTISPECIES: nucleoside hydrolase [Bacillus]|uniref:nucleoside hydrolase n=1 Tax=Bacillus TaxID=1386 RepID=UPI000BB8927B|nr:MULTISPECIES: nucleoside hydrolase [Bacillus]